VMARDVAGDARLVAWLAADVDVDVDVDVGVDVGVDGDGDVDTALDVEAVRSALLLTLPAYMVPAHFVVLDALPLTANGKVDRKALPLPDLGAGATEYVAPRDDVERQLAAIWSEVLKVARIGVHDNFFSLGGHSLLVTKIVSQISKLFNLEMSIIVAFSAPTIAEAATFIRAAQQDRMSQRDEEDAFADIANLLDDINVTDAAK
jgi:acyl carrier protein